jgi:ferritin-like metal-binding protein YciE
MGAGWVRKNTDRRKERGMAETIEDRLVTYLRDAHALEQMSLQMTETAAKATDDPELRELFEHHHDETEERERLIRERIEAHGASTSKLKELGGRFTAMAKGVEAAGHSDSPGRLARDGYVREHTEIAAYELLCRVAERAGDTETADVGRRILENERQTADKIAATWDHATDLALHKAGVSA